MKKYTAPEVKNTTLEINDIIQSSEFVPPIQETIEYLGRRGLNLGGIMAKEIDMAD